MAIICAPCKQRDNPQRNSCLTLDTVSRAPAACYKGVNQLTNLADTGNRAYPNRYANEPIAADSTKEDLVPFWRLRLVSVGTMIRACRDVNNKNELFLTYNANETAKDLYGSVSTRPVSATSVPNALTPSAVQG